jgi:hypothetical protein
MLAIASLILGLAMAATKNRALLPNALPFLIVVAVWVVAYFVIRFQEQRSLQREIDELNEIARGNEGI